MQGAQGVLLSDDSPSRIQFQKQSRAVKLVLPPEQRLLQVRLGTVWVSQGAGVSVL